MTTLKNSRHERFAQLLAEGRSQTDAFRELYPNSWRWQANSVHQKACQLSAKVRPRLAELQADIAKEVCIEKAEIIKILAKSIRNADPAKIPPEKAIDILAKMLGFYAPERGNSEFRFLPDGPVFERLKKAAGRDGERGHPNSELNAGGEVRGGGRPDAWGVGGDSVRGLESQSTQIADSGSRATGHGTPC